MFSDLRLASRTLAKSPLFAFVAIFTLTLGIGVNTAVFSIVNAVVLRGLPFPEQHRVIHIESNNLKAGIDSMGMSALDFLDLRAAQTSFEDLAAYLEQTFNISSEGADPERVTGCAMTFSAPTMLRVPTHLGRWFLPDEGEPNATPVIVLGYSLWQNRFKGDPEILGRTIKVNGEWATVVGVAMPNYRFPEESDAWMPLRRMPEEKRDERYWEVMGRLKDGMTLEHARAELAGIGTQLAQAHPDMNRDVGVVVKKLRDEFVDDGTRQLMNVMFGAVFLVMLIACANVANLLLARAAVRNKEIAVRSALGSGRRRIVQLLLAEALVLSLAGAASGLALAYGLMAVFNHFISVAKPPYWMVFDIDAAGVVYVLALALFSCVAAGLWPAWRASRSDLVAVLKDGGRGSTGFSLSKFTRAMVVGEIVLSCVLLVLSGLYVRSVLAMQSADLGYETAGIFTNRIGLPEAEFKTPEQQREFYRQLLERLHARPEIESAALSSAQPTWNNRNFIVLDGEPLEKDAPRKFATEIRVSGSYFPTLGVKLLQGRLFDERDTATSPPVAIVSSRFVERYWPGENPIGKRFAYGDGAKPEELKWLTVVGVVSPTLQGNFHNEFSKVPQAYTPFSQRDEARFMTVFTKARTGDAANLASVVRTTVRSLNDDLPIYWPQTLDAMVAEAKFFKKLFAWIFGIFGVVALVLSGVGLYGVMAYSVSQRTQEIGVRMALGAEPGGVLRMILREGGVRLVIGLVIGLALGFFVGKLQTNFLYGVTASDTATFVGTALTLGMAGMFACLVPALRAIRVNPVEALRSE